MSNAQPTPVRARPISRLRWWIGGILFASTVINYIDRQTLSLLAPYLKNQYRWTNTDYAHIVIAFRVAYSIGMTACGRLMDRLGTKRGLSITVLWYSIVSLLTPLARGFYSFLGIRFLLGAAESGNWPGAAKAVSRPNWRQLLQLPQTWGTITARSFTDPVFFFIADWFPIYLVAKGISLKSGLIAVWIPFIAADLGNFFGGAVSGYLIKRGWSVGWARKSMVVFGGIGVTLLIPTVFTTNLPLLTVLFATATFCYASFSTIAIVLPADLFPSESVATVSGLSGTAAAIGTIIVFELAGRLSDARVTAGTHLFDPLMILAGLIPFAGMILVLLLVRNTEATERGRVRRI